MANSEVKSICVVSNYRTASTNFTMKLSLEYDLPYAGEAFSHERPFRVGNQLKGWDDSGLNDLREKGWTHWECKNYSDDTLIEEIKGGAEVCFKLMPTHIQTHEKRVELLEACDEVYYLYRKDYLAQLKSWVAMRCTGDWSNNGFIRTTLDEPSMKYFWESHHGEITGLGPTVHHDIDADQCFVDQMHSEIWPGYEMQRALWKEVPGEVYAMEDYYTGALYIPYNRTYNWINEDSIVWPSYDTTTVFV